MGIRIKVYISVFSCIICNSCNDFYKAGNLIALGYPVDTRLRTNVVRRYIDTLIQKEGYRVKPEWLIYNKLVDIDSVNNVILYFKRNPEEMYLISFQGQLLINDVFNETIVQNDWVAKKELMPDTEKNRIMNRFRNEIISRIEALAKRDGVTDKSVK